MSFITAADTDVGTRKKTNQDSILILQAQTDQGPVLLAAVCDGMGGLAKGEVASAAVIRALVKWFKTSLPYLLAEGLTEGRLWQEWTKLINDCNDEISSYGAGLHIDLGTTLAAVLLVQNRYYIMNVGDSRVYIIADDTYQLTKDQTFIQQEIDAGRMTLEEAFSDPRRSVLLQCIGASRYIEPEFLYGEYPNNIVFMICSDGFRHVVSSEELYSCLNPQIINSKADMKTQLENLIRLNISRGEDDNISALLVKT